MLIYYYLTNSDKLRDRIDDIILISDSPLCFYLEYVNEQTIKLWNHYVYQYPKEINYIQYNQLKRILRLNSIDLRFNTRFYYERLGLVDIFDYTIDYVRDVYNKHTTNTSAEDAYRLTIDECNIIDYPLLDMPSKYNKYCLLSLEYYKKTNNVSYLVLFVNFVNYWTPDVKILDNLTDDDIKILYVISLAYMDNKEFMNGIKDRLAS